MNRCDCGRPAQREPVIGYQDIADQSGLKVGYLRVMNHRGDMPEADFPSIPAWYQSTIDDWLGRRLLEQQQARQ